MRKVPLLIVLIIISIACFIPFHRQVAVKINASYVNCYKQLMIPSNWKNWQAEIAKDYVNDTLSVKQNITVRNIKLTSTGVDFLIKQEGSNTLWIQKNLADQDFSYTYTILPGELGVLTTVMVSYKTNLFKQLTAGKTELDKTCISDFKRFMENVKQYYGFDITKSFEPQKKILVNRKMVLRSGMYDACAEMQLELLKYVRDNKLTKVGSFMVQYNAGQADSVQVLIGIPISKSITATNNFVYMEIPPTQVLLAGFKGRYRDKQKAYTALANYMQDKSLHPKIAPLEVFSSRFPAADSDIVDFKLTYPIF
jgi:effector-binding domain-containing protein